MDKYLISSLYKKDALEKARIMELKLNQWVWIPFNDTFRRRKLLGTRVSNIKYLIGAFTDEEMSYLTLRIPPGQKNQKTFGGMFNG